MLNIIEADVVHVITKKREQVSCPFTTQFFVLPKLVDDARVRSARAYAAVMCFMLCVKQEELQKYNAGLKVLKTRIAELILAHADTDACWDVIKAK